MEHRVFRRTRRPPRVLVDRAAAQAVSDLYEALPPERRDTCLMSSGIRQLNAGTRLAGPAITVQCMPGDNLMLHRALLLAERGDVLVVNGGRPSAAQWGYLAALYAEQKGLAGVVVDGCIRTSYEEGAGLSQRPDQLQRRCRATRRSRGG
jgi:4-hydroxy-4-methyl-2-oxoglutarate aldolase